MLKNKRILIGVGGGIAAYKVCEVVSTLAKAGAEVRVMLTEGAQRFITPLTLATLARHPAYTDADFWQPNHHRPLHIDLGEWAEVMAIAPLTANTLGKLAHGLADNLLTNTVLASTCPILLAPAMNTDMWLQQSVQRNWAQVLQDRRYHSLAPGEGVLACDRVGAGRMAEPPELLAALESLLHTGGDRDLQGKHLLINTGGTREFLDPVRFIGNPSTGKMGIALAQAALHRGATVTLVHGVMEPALLAQAKGARQIQAGTAATMHRAMLEHQPDADWVVFAAAVADVKPTHYTAHKLPKADIPDALPLSPVPDIAADLSTHRLPHQKLIGFAAQTGDIVPPARDKLQRKKLDVIVANPIDQPESGFGGDRNQAILLNAAGEQQPVPLASKLHLAHRLYDFVLTNSTLN
ncbi:bifunctional phosphopantothenoylcysteine decarboxylase/phosphopantothenate--cysteine ligase CoaBC [Vacuolonema iberomarrocanum]|uniref:bifunctional phosphopantothenoylcysteine decarboxylase/phosphopantothenate--cysteine ligase CoaBC n=1 Tax=Vacuolonema iberomarrocanum TaxID=3454632 RepID=UPI0019EA71BB|nr:bifunctional phosphopantothenoylcysteine decarboxylase/phosphopantothenate--cysteine ligase CoaBC [filamentous cyanobacterium LEGE 07170]